MNLNELRDKAYKIACDHGFHDKELSNEHWLCLVISELMEAVEADRKGRHFDFSNNDFDHYCRTSDRCGFSKAFEDHIKDTVEDELADAVIRLLDLAGYRDIAIEEFSEDMIGESAESCNDESFTESIYAISTIPVRFEYEYDYLFGKQLNSMLLAILGLAKHLDIDLFWHIEQKMKYNQSRERLHGKKY